MALHARDLILLYTQECIAGIGIMVIVVGALRSLYHLVMLAIYQKFSINYIRFEFGKSIILGLEFMVGADIIGSLIQPDYYSVGLLAIIVLIRTILTYFLNLELTELSSTQQKNVQ